MKAYTIFSTAFFLSLSYLTKPLALVSFGAIFLLPFFYILEKGRINFKRLVKGYLPIAAIILLTTIFTLPWTLAVRTNFSGYYVETDFNSLLNNFKSNLWLSYWWLKAYLTVPIVLLAISSFIFALITRSWKMIWAGVWIANVIFLDSLFGKHFFPRHLFLLVAPIAFISAAAIDKLAKYQKFLPLIIVTIIILPSWKINLRIVNDLQKAPIALEDRQQFLEDWTSGTGLFEISNQLRKDCTNNKVLVFVEDSPLLFWGLPNIFDEGCAKIVVNKALDLPYNQILDLHYNSDFEDQKIYLILNKEPDAPGTWPVKLISSYPKGPHRSIKVYEYLGE